MPKYDSILFIAFSQELNRISLFYIFKWQIHSFEHLNVQGKTTYVLFESASGYSLYEVVEKEEIAGLATQVFFSLEYGNCVGTTEHHRLQQIQ